MVARIAQTVYSSDNFHSSVKLFRGVMIIFAVCLKSTLKNRDLKSLLIFPPLLCIYVRRVQCWA